MSRLGRSLSNAFSGASGAVQNVLPTSVAETLSKPMSSGGISTNLVNAANKPREALTSAYGRAQNVVSSNPQTVKAGLNVAAYMNPVTAPAAFAANTNIGKQGLNVFDKGNRTAALTSVGQQGVAQGVGRYAGGSPGAQVAGYMQGDQQSREILPGGKQDYVFGGAGKEADRQASKAEAAAQAQQQAFREGQIGQLRSRFGLGTGREAESAARALQQARGGYLADITGQARQQADTRLQGDLTALRQQLARSGQLGSSTDVAGRGGLIGNYYNQLAQAQQQAMQAGQNWDTALEQQRLQGEQAVRGGQVNDLTGMRTDLASLMAAGRGANIAGNVFGNALPYAADIGRNAMLVGAY